MEVRYFIGTAGDGQEPTRFTAVEGSITEGVSVFSPDLMGSQPGGLVFRRNPAVAYCANADGGVFPVLSLSGGQTVQVDFATMDVTASETSIAANQSVTFTASPANFASGAPGVVGWVFVPEGATGQLQWINVDTCYGASTCVYAPATNGRMLASSLEAVVGFSATITISAGPPLLDGLHVTCTPANSTRGINVRCETKLVPGQPYTVLRRTARGKGFTVEDRTNISHAAGETDVWEGEAVASSKVVVRVRVGTDGSGPRLTNETPGRFEVQARTWAEWKYTTLTEHQIVVASGKKFNMKEYPVLDTNLGFFQAESPPDPTIARAADGPNRGLGYIQDAYTLSNYGVVTHPAMYPPGLSTPKGSVKWYNDQNGLGSGSCSTPAEIAILARSVEVHEGVHGAPINSHPGVGNNAFAQLKPHLIFEALYSQKNDADFVEEVGKKLNQVLDKGQYDADQKQFDAVDVPIVLSSAGCNFDFNPNDR